MKDKDIPIGQILSLLAAAPARAAALTGDLTSAQLLASPAPGEWSTRDLLAHLRACSDMWGQGIEIILGGDHPTLRAVNPRTWIKKTDYCRLDFQTSLLAYTAQRVGLLKLLTGLPPGAWLRAGTFKGAGAPLERTVHSFAARLAVHERPYLHQFEYIARALTGQV